MKFRVLLILLIALSSELEAQHSYFNSRYDINGGPDNLGGVVSCSDSGFIAASAFQVSGSYGFFSLKIDKNGDTLQLNKYIDDSFTFRITPIACSSHDSTSYLFTGYSGDTDRKIPIVICFNLQGDTIGVGEYPIIPNGAIGRAIIKHPDGGFLIQGDYVSDTLNQWSSYFAIKLDSNLDVEWSQTYPGSGTAWYFSGTILSDTTFLISGAQTQSRGYLLKADKMGNLLWKKTYPTVNTLNAIEFGDSILCWTFADKNTHYINLLYWLDKTTGTEISKDTVQTQHGRVYAGGIYPKNKTQLLLGGSEYSNFNNGKAWSALCSTSGAVFWERTYQFLPNKDYNINSVVKAIDDGILLGEYVAPGGGFTQDIWLVKVDSVGCLTPNCNVGIPESQEGLSISIYPNPASSTLNVELDAELKEGSIEVYTMTGQFVRSYELGGSEIEIDVSDSKSGTYILIIKDREGDVGR